LLTVLQLGHNFGSGHSHDVNYYNVRTFYVLCFTILRIIELTPNFHVPFTSPKSILVEPLAQRLLAMDGVLSCPTVKVALALTEISCTRLALTTMALET
jgi:hypothetical protein